MSENQSFNNWHKKFWICWHSSITHTTTSESAIIKMLHSQIQLWEEGEGEPHRNIASKSK